ncbi:MAG: thioredoxin fold domain-containing protein [Pseudomonadota bacterium]|jgi:thioredoxin-related protein
MRISGTLLWWSLALGLAFSAPVSAKKAAIQGVGEYVIPAWFKQSFLDLREDARGAAAGGKHLLVYFGQPGCPYCAELFNNNFSQLHIVEYTRRHFDAIDINMWGDREVTDFTGRTLTEKALAAKLKVWFTPTILFFDGQGRQVLRINGYYPPHQFFAALQYVAEGQGQRTSLREHLARLAPLSAAGRLHDEPFFAKPPYDLSRAAGKPIAVVFEQKDCIGCDELHQKVFSLPETRHQLARFHVIQLDRWGDTPVVTPAGVRTTARAFADTLNVAYVPSVVLFNEGREVIRIEAMLKAFHVQSVLDYVASGAYKRQPSLQRFIQERADRLRESGTVVDLWQ